MKKLLFVLLIAIQAQAQTFDFSCFNLDIPVLGSGSVGVTISGSLVTISAIPDSGNSFLGYREITAENTVFDRPLTSEIILPLEGIESRMITAHFRRTIADVKTLRAEYNGESYNPRETITIIAFGPPIKFITERYKGVSSLELGINRGGTTRYLNSDYDYCTSRDIDESCGGETQTTYWSNPTLGGTYIASVFARGGPVEDNIIYTIFDETPYEREGWDLTALTDGSKLIYSWETDNNVVITQEDTDEFSSVWFDNLGVIFNNTTFEDVSSIVLQEYADMNNTEISVLVDGSEEIQSIVGEVEAEVTVSGSYTSEYLPSLQHRYELWVINSDGEPQVKVGVGYNNGLEQDVSGTGSDPIFTVTASDAFALNEVKKFRVKYIADGALGSPTYQSSTGFLTRWSDEFYISFE